MIQWMATVPNVNRIVGAVLREVREESGLPAVDAAHQGGTSASALTSWERGDRTISTNQLIDLARVYRVDAGMLLTFIEYRVNQIAA